MTWARLDDGFHAHPKIDGLSLAARGLFATALSYAAHYETDGQLPERVINYHARGHAGRKALKELLEAGLFEPVEAGYSIHDYLDYNRSREEIEAERVGARSRQASKRRRERQIPIPFGDSAPRHAVSHATRDSGEGGGTTPTSEEQPELHAPAQRTVVDDVLDVLRGLDRDGWLVDDVGTRVGVENAIAAHPNRDPLSAAHLTVTAASDPAWRTSSPQRAFAIMLGKQPEGMRPERLDSRPAYGGRRERTCPLNLCDGGGIVIDEESDSAHPCRCRLERVA